MLKKLKRILKTFIRLSYEGDKVVPLVYFKVPFVRNRIFQLRLPVSINRKKCFAFFYGREEIQKNKIVFDNYKGKSFGCNPKYVTLKLMEKYPNAFDIVWTVKSDDKKAADFPKGVRLVDYGSCAAKKEYATAKVWVQNYHLLDYIRRGLHIRPGQYFVQMWHGSLGIKKIENDVPLLINENSFFSLAKESSEMTTHWISNSAFETDVYKQAFWGVENVLEYGHPRNDLLINGDDSVVDKVKRHFGIEGKKVMFYAPTFREDYRMECYQIDYACLKQTLEEEFGGEWVFVVRLHPRVRKFSNQILPEVDYIFDGTFYPDIQELILTADSMITDYSSCIFDFLLTRRPGFIFATDIEEYNTERGFYYPLETTPFPVATDNETLLENIRNFDLEEYKENTAAFLDEKGCVEDGKASERVAHLIAELIDV